VKAYKVMIALLLVLLAVPFLGRAFATVGPGILHDVKTCPKPGSSVGTDSNGMFIVNPGGSYYVILTNIVGLPSKIDVWIAGHHQNGDSWQIHVDAFKLEGEVEYKSDCFAIPQTAGCTITVHYYELGIVAAAESGPSQVGHMKNYYPGSALEVPCTGVSIPEIPLGPEVLSALGLLAISVITRKRSKK